MTDEQRSALIKIAGELVRCEHMPPYFVADWELPKSTPIGARRKIREASQLAHANCTELATRTVSVVDAMAKEQRQKYPLP